ncbi:MAG: hypothetical protein QM673_08545 [Gordonia sp. (in: high G+C Gram-positive bacteria)]
MPEASTEIGNSAPSLTTTAPDKPTPAPSPVVAKDRSDADNRRV